MCLVLRFMKLKFFNIKIHFSALTADYNADDEKLQTSDIGFDMEIPKRPLGNEFKGALDAVQNATIQ